jgi:cytochrome c
MKSLIIILTISTLCFNFFGFYGLASEQVNDEDGFEVSDEILAIVGDIDYGEYLSSECTTCHHAQGLDEGIPSITGWPIESFVWALHSYKSGARNHPIMEMITQRLSNEEIASLAIFFESINN